MSTVLLHFAFLQEKETAIVKFVGNFYRERLKLWGKKERKRSDETTYTAVCMNTTSNAPSTKAPSMLPAFQARLGKGWRPSGGLGSALKPVYSVLPDSYGCSLTLHSLLL